MLPFPMSEDFRDDVVEPIDPPAGPASNGHPTASRLSRASLPAANGAPGDTHKSGAGTA